MGSRRKLGCKGHRGINGNTTLARKIPHGEHRNNLSFRLNSLSLCAKLNPKINRNFEVFDPVDFLAVLSQHIPDKGVQMIRYYGLYSNKMRGCARKGTGDSSAGGHLRSQLFELKTLPPGSPPPPRKLPSRKWRDVILQAWHVDPLQCPVCQKQMRVIAFIDHPEVVEKIIRHLKLWWGPAAFAPARPPPSPGSESISSDPSLCVSQGARRSFAGGGIKITSGETV